MTGAAGFIGSHLTERLLAEGWTVRAFDLYNSNGSFGWLDGVEHKELTKVLGDVRDAQQVARACEGVDVVFHLAALIDVPYSYAAPESYVQTNVLGTLNVLEGCRRAGVGRVVITSTSEVYGTPEVLPIRETWPLQAQSPYAASKIAADQLALSYHRSFGLPVVILRPFNTYGPRQSTRAFLPSILTQLIAGKTEVRVGRMDTRRDMTYVADTVAAFLKAAEEPRIEGEVIHLGTGRAPTIAEWFAFCCDVVGGSANDAYMKQEPARLRPDGSEVLVLQSDPTKALHRLDWLAEVTPMDGIERTVEWLRGRARRAA